MAVEAELTKRISRRSFVIGLGQSFLIVALGARLAWLQLVEGKKYRTLADKNRINTKIIAPARGQITDRYGVPLAFNNQNFRVLMVPEQTDDIQSVLEKLSKVINLPDYKISNAIELAKKSPSFLPIEVIDSLTWEELTKLEVNITDFPGLMIDEGEIRNYPFADSTGHIVGYVGAVSENEIGEEPVFRIPGFRIGKTGIEKSMDDVLRGKAGDQQVEVNVQGREVRQLSLNESLPGKRVLLSVDAELQRFCHQKLSQHKSASVVIMDAHTGAIYAMASHPVYDPNLFTRGISSDNWEELLNNPAFPLNNKALTGLYPPGSTFKMITALAALEGGYAKANTTVNCTGTYEYGSDKFRCWKLSGHGITTVTSALMKSCDTYFYELSTEIGIDNIALMAHKFGLGEKYNFDLPEEKSGLVPTKDWKVDKYGQQWRPGETIVASIGQGYILATPMQLAVMTARLVNGGYAVQPWLVGYVGDKKIHQEKWNKINVKESNLSIVKKGMDRVVNHEDGTAYGSRIDDEDMTMGGKTGTAQVKRINRAERAMGIMNEDLDWKYRHHALFVGYAPLKNPRYICSVVVEHGGGGSAVAAPLAKELLIEAQKRDPAKSDIQSST